MIGRVINKLHNKKGETLAEVLMTILLVGIISAGFMVVVETAHNINANVVETDKAFYEEVSDAEAVVFSKDPTGPADEGTVEIKVSNSGYSKLDTQTVKLKVETYGMNDDKKGKTSMVSYKVKEIETETKDSDEDETNNP